jgi:protein-tyrosine phosphatase
MTEMAENLWQGGGASGLVLPAFIEHVLNLYPWEAYEVRDGLSSFREVRLHDDARDVLYDVVSELAAWVNHCRASGPMLVHCQAGLNRSGLVITNKRDRPASRQSVEHQRVRPGSSVQSGVRALAAADAGGGRLASRPG